MSETVPQRLERGDAELIAAVRAGDTDAYGALFERHRTAALRLARQLLPGAESEDLVSEAFTKVLVQLQAGRGPDLAFRAYLLTAIRRLHVDRIRSMRRLRTTDDEAELDQHVEFFDTAAATFERGTAADAFASLPERWQLVLWHLDVEGQKPAEVAPLLDMSANSVSALAYRAREGLRQAYLQHHLADTASGDCRWATERLGAHVRKGLSSRDAGRVDEHLDECRRCMGIYLELTEVNSDLAGILAPVILGTAAGGYLAAGATGVATTTGVALGFKALVSTVVEPVKAAVAGASIQGAAAVVVVGALATSGVYAAANGFGHRDNSRVAAQVKPSPRATTPAVSPAEKSTAKPATGPTVGPTPLVAPAIQPAVQLAVQRTTDSPAKTLPVPARATPTKVPATDPPLPPPPIVATDLGIGAIAIARDSGLFQRRITIPVSSSTEGNAKVLTLTMTVSFDRPVHFRGVLSSEWNCGQQGHRTRISSMSCTRTQSGSAIPGLVFSARGLSLAGTATITAAGNVDPDTANNSAHFRAGLGILGR